jgi:tripeptide aminopeptidase
MPSTLINLFLDAVKVNALSLRERPMAEFIRTALEGLPVRVIEDETARHINGECGNLVCVPDSFNPTKPAVALLAHMDTPRPTTNVHPQITDTQISSDGTTALGVDNRAGSSILVHVLREHLKARLPGNFIVVFTVAEEIGLFGAKHVDLKPYNVKMCFVFDCSKRPGTFIQSAVGCSLYNATFIGRSSHAAVAPEKGINAIHVAAKAIAGIPMGRLSPTMTSNIGMIVGGTATNVVPDRCTINGEVREFLEQIFSNIAAQHSATAEFQIIEDFAPFRLKPESDVFKETVSVLKALGLTPNPIDYLGGSDANMLNAKGIPAVNLGIGAQNPHANEEFILLEDLFKSAEIAREIIKRSDALV